MLLFALALPPLASKGDLMIELNAGQHEASRILVKPPRARVDYVGRHYQIFDQERDALVTVLPDAGVLYRERPDVLADKRDGSLEAFGAFMDRLASNLARLPKLQFGSWDDLATLWGVVDTGFAPPAPIRVESLESLDEVARAGGFECTLYRVHVRARSDRIIACLATKSEMGIAVADLETLRKLFAYLERLRMAAQLVPMEPLGLPPGLMAELIAHTDQMVLALVNQEMDTNSIWEIHQLWSADLDESRFHLPRDPTQVVVPYAQ